MNYYIAKDFINLRDYPNGKILGVIRPNTIVYHLGNEIEDHNRLWANIFTYDLEGNWHNAYSAVSSDDNIYLEPFVPHVVLENPYKSEVHLTQLFGENGAPLYKKIGMYGHNGVDFFSNNKNIYSINPGQVVTGYDVSGYGNYVIITGTTLKVLYAHLKQIIVENGSYAQPGTLIGIQGNTTSPGSTMGEHLHIELRRVDVNNEGNGFLGRIDILPYMKWNNIIFPDYCSILNNYKG